MYITAAQSISPQHTFGNIPLPTDLVAAEGDKQVAILPDHKNLIDPRQARRMSRIIKMGVIAGLACLRDAGIKSPDAIITGTGYGCMEDTGTFLNKMVQQREDLLTPTSFIQSTHNTVGAQIALLLGCHGYNNTFVNGGASFEHALLDAMMLLNDGEARNVLVGGLDEITNDSHAILQRFGLYKHATAGEGAAFFCLSNDLTESALAQVIAVQTIYKPDGAEEMAGHIGEFIVNNGLTKEDIDLVLDGKNGDRKFDGITDQVLKAALGETPSISYKHLCGEYPTSTSFSLWLVANIIRTGTIPAVLGDYSANKRITNVLIYNNYLNIHHSLILVSTC